MSPAEGPRSPGSPTPWRSRRAGSAAAVESIEPARFEVKPERAINEVVRVLRLGGRLLIADVRGTRHYEAQLAEVGMTDIARRRLGWQFWWGGPWAATRLVTAMKPK
jgi:hypothetical protein